MLGWFSAEAERASCFESLAVSGSAGHLRREDLQGDISPELRVAGPVHLAHPARAEERGHFVRAKARAG